MVGCHLLLLRYSTNTYLSPNLGLPCRALPRRASPSTAGLRFSALCFAQPCLTTQCPATPSHAPLGLALLRNARLDPAGPRQTSHRLVEVPNCYSSLALRSGAGLVAPGRNVMSLRVLALPCPATPHQAAPCHAKPGPAVPSVLAS